MLLPSGTLEARRQAQVAPEPIAALKAAVPDIGEGSCLLVVEDDPGVRAFVVATLEHAGYRVLVAGSPAQVAVLSDGLGETIDVPLTDLVMPGGNGRGLGGTAACQPAVAVSRAHVGVRRDPKRDRVREPLPFPG